MASSTLLLKSTVSSLAVASTSAKSISSSSSIVATPVRFTTPVHRPAVHRSVVVRADKVRIAPQTGFPELHVLVVAEFEKVIHCK